MKRLAVLFGTACLLGAAVALSGPGRSAPGPGASGLSVKVEERNPWTHTRLNNDPTSFQFAIVSDRTGGHRAQVFSRAVEVLNLLQPEFVLSVGDLIEGGNRTANELDAQWKEFNGYVNKLQMPFFYLPGNHDHGTAATAKAWKEKFGRSYYHFVYQQVLFLCLNSDDPPGSGKLSKDQLQFAREVLDANRGVRWTIVALHRPIWTAANLTGNGWLEVEKALGGRPYTVFAGHIHHYQKFVRNGRAYYQLATTGGVSKMRGVRYGEFDHVVWVTMKDSGPVLANVMVDAVLPEDLKPIRTDEPGVSGRGRRPTYPVRGQVFFEGTPPVGAQVVFHSVAGKGKRAARADGRVAADGSFTLTTNTANDGAPAGEYEVTVTWREPRTGTAGKAGPNRLPERYAQAGTSGLRATVKPGPNEIVLELKR